ncbi:UNVERIFIED_CONTAM: hypothetical protein GTU68_064300 [Idotea baltica]|nr:hypothetical protein [Idotea baltica]
MKGRCYFSLFDIEPDFSLNLDDLSQRYLHRAKQVHPDCFIGAPDTEKRRALEQSAQLNDAYNTLKNSASRAYYMLTFQGKLLPKEQTIQDPEFLIQQIEWRDELETLVEEKSIDTLNVFKRRMYKTIENIEQEFSKCWDSSEHRVRAERLMRRLQFLDKLLADVRHVEEQIDDY